MKEKIFRIKYDDSLDLSADRLQWLIEVGSNWNIDAEVEEIETPNPINIKTET